jgi:hypothetical protein
MSALLIATALIEFVTGLVLVVSPSALAHVLLGSSLDNAIGFTIARVAGTALLSLGVACWFAREDGQSPAGKGLVAAMLLYDLGVVEVLVAARYGSGLSGIAFWPAVGLHTGMAIWCVAYLRSSSSTQA